MKRRGFVQALVAVSGVGILEPQKGSAQQPGANQSAPGIPLNPTQGIQPPARAAEELPKLDPSVPDAASDGTPRFFTPTQYAALRRLSDAMMPAAKGSPGALAAGAPEFLDFLIGKSSTERRQVYRAGLDGLNAQSAKAFGKTFAEADPAQSLTLLEPLSRPWTFEEPTDPVARFLRVAKLDVRTATVNSREYGAGRRVGGGGLYWRPLD